MGNFMCDMDSDMGPLFKSFTLMRKKKILLLLQIQVNSDIED